MGGGRVLRIYVDSGFPLDIKTYPQRVWKARGRFVRDLLGSFIFAFAIGGGGLFGASDEPSEKTADLECQNML